MAVNPFMRMLALPYARLELPGWRRVLNRFVGHEREEGAPVKVIRGKVHGYRMTLSLVDWSERWTYFLGRYYEAHTQRLFQLALRPGDVFVDIGANIGMTVLVACRCVGPRGRVVAFEPNPAVFARLRGHVEINGLGAMTDLRNRGLAEVAGALELHVPLHTGEASFAPLATDQGGNPARAVRVAVGVGDEELAGLPGAPMFIKIDVEGFEPRVLTGLRRTLAARRAAVVTEAVPAHLERAGSSLGALFALMHEAGYAGHSVEHHARRVGFGGRLRLRRVRGPGPGLADDLLWLVEGSVHADRLASWVC